jgi:uncharacterized membrane protein YphA (DoxX/SURF4 family)
MKYFVTLLRILVGLLFIFSGLIKSNDPTGFSYKLDEYFTVFADDLSAKQDSFDVNIQIGEENSSRKIAFPSANTQIQLIYKQGDWIPVDIDDETRIYISSAQVSLDGELLHEEELNAMDSASIAQKIAVRLQYNGADLLSETLSYTLTNMHEGVKSVDITEYQISNAWYVGFLNGLRDYALPIAIIICVIEIVLGFALLIGWAGRFTLWLYLLMLLFFAFLTWYSAEFDKVTDCGCFGDAIKLSPWESFNKDLILLIATVLMMIGVKYIKPLFSNPFSVRFLTIIAITSTAFSVYCWHYLPVKNFLQFKEGSNLKQKMKVPEGGREKDHIVREYFYDNDGETITVLWDSDDNSFTPSIESNWTYKGVGEDKILATMDEPPIHDFKIMDESMSADYVEDFFNSSKYKIMIVMNDLEQSRLSAMPKIKELVTAWTEAGYEVFPLTASPVEEVDVFRHEHQLDFPFYYGDKTNLKSIIRSNPGLVLVDSATVVKTWPSTRLPSVKKLIKLTE